MEAENQISLKTGRQVKRDKSVASRFNEMWAKRLWRFTVNPQLRAVRANRSALLTALLQPDWLTCLSLSRSPRLPYQSVPVRRVRHSRAWWKRQVFTGENRQLSMTAASIGLPITLPFYTSFRWPNHSVEVVKNHRHKIKSAVAQLRDWHRGRIALISRSTVPIPTGAAHVFCGRPIGETVLVVQTTRNAHLQGSHGWNRKAFECRRNREHQWMAVNDANTPDSLENCNVNGWKSHSFHSSATHSPLGGKKRLRHSFLRSVQLLIGLSRNSTGLCLGCTQAHLYQIW